MNLLPASQKGDFFETVSPFFGESIWGKKGLIKEATAKRTLVGRKARERKKHAKIREKKVPCELV